MKDLLQYFLTFFTGLILFSCTSQKMKYGTKTEIQDKADSAKSLSKIKHIKSLDFSEFIEGKFENEKIAVNYRLLKPKKIEQTQKYPLVLVFHGSGAIGVNNTAQMGVLAKMWLLPENREKYPVYVLSPQFPERSSNYHLDQDRNVLASESGEYLNLVLNSLDFFIEKENIDKNRVYVMGFSMGGSTTSNAITNRPDLFAAAVNISGVSQFNKINELKNLPIWMVHGSLDTENSIKSNLKFFGELKNNGNILFWEFKDKYHNNILSAELVDEIPKWLMKKHKSIRN
ncbi:carboxylesterase family protein [Chryseobacterium caseinilyticum]|uniref:Prolyl oligopeptidase family serine peptidase n=1 Tax=Chryseobacterium caseinilyticum TaxID=2771428 RepID=A0ABR8Z6C9_9FLAO|nr:prolyl oligopeptidase family serine peptidase [Chryseobacterium caseinilyticum]MBD8080844.1 prolyl oligopeptidase family serine peptidase [Chryseobacterium caseinilyticum]